MTLRTVHDHRTAESVEDLRQWLTHLPDAPQVHETVVLHCASHGEEQPTWAYVEADAEAGLARRRCVACGSSHALLDSQERWTHPPMWSCRTCEQSLAELVAGLHLPDGEHVEWVVLGARCVECGRVDGLTDVVVDRLPVAEVLGQL